MPQWLCELLSQLDVVMTATCFELMALPCEMSCKAEQRLLTSSWLFFVAHCLRETRQKTLNHKDAAKARSLPGTCKSARLSYFAKTVHLQDAEQTQSLETVARQPVSRRSKDQRSWDCWSWSGLEDYIRLQKTACLAEVSKNGSLCTLSSRLGSLSHGLLQSKTP